MSEDNHAPGGALISSTWRAVFYAVLIGMALIEVFVTFRGLRSAAGMEQAQLARELARGNGWTTKCVRPAAWKQVLEAHPETAPDAVPSTSLPPLPALVLAPLFKVMPGSWAFEPASDGVVYALDRVVAAVGVTALLLMVLNLHGLARDVFDEKVAVVTALSAGFAKPLWDLAVSGSPRVLLALELVLALRLVLALLRRQQSGVTAGRLAVGLGLVLAAMVGTHGMGWLWAAVVLGWLGWVLPREAVGRLVGLAGAPVVIVLGLWAARNWSVTGDLLGTAMLTLRAIFSTAGEELATRSFNEAMPAAGLQQIVRVTTLRLAAQWGEIFAHLGLLLGAVLFPLALAHRFRRRECRQMAGLLGALLAGSSLAMALLGPVTELENEHNVLLALAGPLAVFGTAVATMLWLRWHVTAATFWDRWGHAVVLAGVSAFPLVAALPDSLRAGLVLRGHLSQWPPYAADRVAVVGQLLEADEVLLADAPWFTAWYTDRASIWLPVKRADLPPLKSAVEATGKRLAGMVVTPVSARAAYLGQHFDGPWGEWPDVVLRGPLLAFDREVKPWEDFPYPVTVPLIGFSTGQKEGLGLLMAFYTDRPRQPKR